jgi:hypothetical protein
MTALCYFNALRELGGARRIVEDEVRDRAARYGHSVGGLIPTTALCHGGANEKGRRKAGPNRAVGRR